MIEHASLISLRKAKLNEVILLGEHKIISVESTATEKRILDQGIEEEREMGSINIVGSSERIIVFGRPTSIPFLLFSIGLKELGAKSGDTIYISHCHWESNLDIRPSVSDLIYARSLQDKFPDINLNFRIVAGTLNDQVSYSYFPVPLD